MEPVMVFRAIQKFAAPEADGEPDTADILRNIAEDFLKAHIQSNKLSLLMYSSQLISAADAIDRILYKLPAQLGTNPITEDHLKKYGLRNIQTIPLVASAIITELTRMAKPALAPTLQQLVDIKEEYRNTIENQLDTRTPGL